MDVLEMMVVSQGLSTCVAIQEFSFKLTPFLSLPLCTFKGSLATQQTMGL